MAKYVFECQECNLKFERNLKMGDHPTHPCPSCKDEAPRLLIGEGFGFAFEQNGASPANSGVHDHDYPTADKAVGRSAAERWATMRARQSVKDEARKQGHTHALIRHTGDGFVDYEPMSPVGQDARKKLTKAAIAAHRASKGPAEKAKE